MTDKKNDYTIVGIDGGGTHTRGILCRGGKELARAESGTTRIGAVGVGESCERLLNIITELCHVAEIESEELDIVVIGLAGVWLEEEKKRSQHLLKTLARGQDVTLNDVFVTSDAELAIEGAFDGGNGIITIVGTGSIALGRTGKKEKLVRCGGWGIELDDEGSGAWIGKEGLTAIVRSIDGRGDETKLTQVFAGNYPIVDLNQPRSIVKAYGEGAFQYHMLTPDVMKCAEEGDPVCLDIIMQASFHLAELPNAIKDNFKTKTIPVALMGGIIDADTLLAKLLKKEIQKSSKLKLVNPKGNALDGALMIGEAMIEDYFEG